MKNIVCICNTYMQLIVAIQLKNTIKADDNVVCILSDHSKNSERIVANLEKTGFFYKTVYAECRHYNDADKNKVKDLGYIMKCARSGFELNEPVLDELAYDELIFFNYNFFAINVYDKICKKNPNVIASRYEEGILSYDSRYSDDMRGGRVRLVEKLRKLLGKKNVPEYTYFYCMYPDFYKGKCTPVGVPLITDDRCREILSKAFEIDGDKLYYPQKYIFMASIGDFEGGKPVGELDIALKIADLVGRNNLLVKVHPRDRTGAFEKAGLTVDKNSSVPWEVIQMNYDFSNHVFMTVASGSVFGVNVMIKNRAKVFYLYKLCQYEGNRLIEESVRTIERLFANSDKIDLSGYRIADALEEILG